MTIGKKKAELYDTSPSPTRGMRTCLTLILDRLTLMLRKMHYCQCDSNMWKMTYGQSRGRISMRSRAVTCLGKPLLPLFTPFHKGRTANKTAGADADQFVATTPMNKIRDRSNSYLLA